MGKLCLKDYSLYRNYLINNYDLIKKSNFTKIYSPHAITTHTIYNKVPPGFKSLSTPVSAVTSLKIANAANTVQKASADSGA